MPALNFKKEFAALVELGLKDPSHPEAKRQSIRAIRKDGRDPRPGQILYLYFGLRTAFCRKLGEVECKEQIAITIEPWDNIIVGLKSLNFKEEKEFARQDGFKSTDDFFKFFKTTHGLPFYGFLYKW